MRAQERWSGDVEDFSAVVDAARRDQRFPIWHAKELNQTADDVLARTSGETLRQNAVTTVQLFFGDFAILRSDNWQTPAVALQILFKTGGAWRVAGEASIRAAQGARQPAFNPHTAEQQVLQVLDGYYQAVETGDAAALRTLFHPQWHMKNHEDGEVVSEDRAQFMRRIEAGPTVDYIKDRQVADVQILYDRMAYVRIDKPSTPGVTVFLFLRLNERWLIVDKAWSMAR